MIISTAKEVLKIESSSIEKLSEYINHNFETLVNHICQSNGRIIISGIGKSGLIGKKIVATLVSTGTNAMFLHPVEALHGDLGMVDKDDIFIAISNSGETAELIQLIPVIKQMGLKIAAFTGGMKSTLARLCDMVIYTGVEKEACPFNMAPTASTTAQLAMGDALAVVLINQKHFKKSDFIKSHPGGKLGQRLANKVGQMMFSASTAPSIQSGASLKSAIQIMDQYRLGAVIVLNKEDKLKGIITDGDVRHCVATCKEPLETILVDSVMTENPISLTAQSYLYDALNLMEKYQITVLPIVSGNFELEGILHLHDILGKGSFQFNGGV
jgi:arabinose-5-phosphate isomerase